ncbi:toxin [Actinomadura rubrisoli]|uniref:Toxin n=1 Tax=Actinomadura rubrisoli TaxID=2530368 RepID=A0A4R5C397_9ACTN|nr:toxin [Actinomadura rubrisoli]TDD93345.1 toxin [Actinomadura rubrisoli]
MADTKSFVFQNHFHPYVGMLVERLNQQSVDGLLDLAVQQVSEPFFDRSYDPNDPAAPGEDASFKVTSFPKNIDVGEAGPYSVYNWELFFHAPVTIAVHLSKNQRFAEAQRWFHHVFDPTNTDSTTPVPDRFWKFVRFRDPRPGDMPRVDELVAVLSRPPSELGPEERILLASAALSYEALRREPFRPHRVARTRVVAYQYYVVMKYLENLIAWGDSLFRLDTAESINEATQLYVLAGNILGPRPAEVPRHRSAPRMSYRRLKDAGLGAFGNALVELENLLPFAQTTAPGAAGAGTGGTALLGIGRSLYFCVPRNDQLVGYWDAVADRLFKIRNCQDITGAVRRLSLFAPALDPGLMSRATAAGIDIAGAVAGTRAPASPVRAALLIQKALEITAEVRSAGAALLSAMDRRDGEELARLRQGHEIGMARLARDVRFLGWKEAEANTEALLRARAISFARYRHFQLLLGRPESEVDKLREVGLTRVPVTEENFSEVHQQLVGRYATAIAQESRPAPRLARDGDPRVQAGAQSQGSLDLIANEFAELNIHMPAARDKQREATDIDIMYGVLGMLPNMGIDIEPFGLGGHVEFGGPLLSAVGRTLASATRGAAEQDVYEGGRAAKIAGYQRRDLDFVQQSNQAALELMQNGRQLIAALVHEQVARRDHDAAGEQIKRAQEVDAYLASKDTNTELYTWLRGEVARSFAERYRMAVDVARAAEQAVKRELMRPEIDDTTFIGFSHWDTGRRGLQAGERLHHDLTRLQMAYLENNRREFELTTHVSLRMLDPLALLELRSRGSCQFSVPEWLYDLEAPGHYFRRVRTVALSLPAVTGPYTSVAATLSLRRSSVRRDPGLLDNRYTRMPGEDPRFLDYPGALESVVTSTAVRDAGLVDAAPRDDRYLPFEGAGAVSEWTLSLPADLRTFDYTTISDAVLHIGYTARPGVRADAVAADLRERFAAATQRTLARSFSLRHDFPTAWAAFLAGGDDLSLRIEKGWFPYFTQSATLTLSAVELYGITGDDLVRGPSPLAADALPALDAELSAEGAFTLAVPADDAVLRRDRTADPYLIVRYTIR